MVAVKFISIAFFFGLWLLLAKEDYFTYKISNKRIVQALALAGTLYLALLIHTAAGYQGWLSSFYTWDFFKALSIHLVMTLAAALLLWQLRIWPAGDAKLFIVLGVLLPVMDPASPLIPYRTGVSSLINTFLPAALFIAGQAFFWTARKRMLPRLRFYRSLNGGGFLAHARKEFSAGAIRESWQELTAPLYTMLQSGAAWVRIANAAGRLAFIGVVFFILQKALPFSWLTPAAAIAYAYFYQKAQKGRQYVFHTFHLVGVAAAIFIVVGMPQDRLLLAGLLAKLAVFGIFMDFGRQAIIAGLKRDNALVVFLAAPLLLLFLPPGFDYRLILWPAAGVLFGAGGPLISMLKAENIRWIPAGEIKPFLLLADPSIKLLEHDPEYFRSQFHPLYADGLTPSQAQAMRDWCKRQEIAQIAVVEVIPFAFWIFLGYFITWALGRDVLAFIKPGF